MHEGSNSCTSLPILATAYHFILANLVVVRWYLIVVLFCISLVTNNVKHLFMCVSATCISSLEKCLFKSFAHTSILLSFFNCWVVRVLYIFWILDPNQIYYLQIFSPVFCLFTFLMVPLKHKSFYFRVLFTYFFYFFVFWHLI